MSFPSPSTVSTRAGLRGALTALVTAALTVGGVAAAPAQAAVGDTQVAWLEVEQGVISTNPAPALNSGDHGNFSGSGSYTFRETGMTSTMTFTAPAAGTYPVWIRYAAGPLSAEENVTRGMGLLTNGGARQTVPYELTASWEDWEFARADVTLVQGTNTLTLQCDRGVEMCRLNFDAIQVGGVAPDTCVPTAVPAGSTRLFDGTFATFDQWRKAGGGGFGHQTDCSIRGFRGPGATWNTTQQSGPYTLGLDWRRGDADDASSVYLASSSTSGATPNGGYAVRIGTSDTGTIVPTGGTAQPADAAAVAAAVRPLGQWNRFAIQLTPARIRVLLNGTVVNTLDRTAATAGFIGLENRGGTAQVDFRDIQLSPTVELGPGRAGAPCGEGRRHHAQPRRRVHARQPRRRRPALGHPHVLRRHRAHRLHQPHRARGRPRRHRHLPRRDDVRPRRGRARFRAAGQHADDGRADQDRARAAVAAHQRRHRAEPGLPPPRRLRWFHVEP